MYKMYSSNRSQIFACYAEEYPTPASPFYGLIEAQLLYNKKEYAKALPHLDKIIATHAAKARDSQQMLKEHVWESKERIFTFKELNAVGAALVIKGLIYLRLNDKELAEKSLQEQLDNYLYAYCWNPEGWFIRLDRVSTKLLLEEIHHLPARKK